MKRSATAARWRGASPATALQTASSGVLGFSPQSYAGYSFGASPFSSLAEDETFLKPNIFNVSIPDQTGTQSHHRKLADADDLGADQTRGTASSPAKHRNNMERGSEDLHKSLLGNKPTSRN